MRNFLKSSLLSVSLMGCLALGAVALPQGEQAQPAVSTPACQTQAPCLSLLDQGDPRKDDGYVYDKDSGIRFYPPDEWDAEVDGKDLYIAPEDESVWVTVWQEGDMGLDEATKKAPQLLRRFLTQIEIDDDFESGEENGVPVVWLSGSGESEGDEYSWQATFVQADRLVIFLTIGEESDLAKHGALLDELDESIERLEPHK